MKSKYTFNEIEGFLDKCNATGIKILNGTSKQFLKADGSLDTKEYLSTTGGTINGTSPYLLNINNTNNGDALLQFNKESVGVGYSSIDGALRLFNNGRGYPTIKLVGGKAAPIFRYNSVDYDILTSTGGTITSSDFAPLIIKRNDTNGVAVRLENKNGLLGNLGIAPNASGAYPFFGDGTTNYALLHEDNYSSYALPLSGGTIHGTSVNPLNINTTNEAEVGVYFNQNNTSRAWVGYSASGGAGIYDVATKSTLGITIGGVPHFNKKALLHSGNVGEYTAGAANHLNATEVSGEGSNSILDTLFVSGKSGISINIARNLGSSLLFPTRDTIVVNYSWNGRYGQQWAIEDTSHKILVRTKNADQTGAEWSDWKTIAFTDSDITGTALKAKNLVDSEGKSVVYISGTRFYIGDTIYPTTSTHILGKDVFLRYGASATNGLILNSSGNVTIGAEDKAGTSSKLYVNGYIRVANDYGVLSSATEGGVIQIIGIGESNILSVGTDACIQYGVATNIYGKYITYVVGNSLDTRVTAMTITDEGNVGIGPGSPTVPLAIRPYANASMQLGTTDGIVLSIQNTSQAFGINFNVESTGHGNIQVGRIKDSATAYALNLNPLGGAVNIASANAHTYVLGHLLASKDLYMSGFLMMNRGGEGIYIAGASLNWHNTNNAWSASLLSFAKDSFTIHPSTSINGNLSVAGTSTFNAGITVPSGQSITFVDASGNNHVVSWDDTAGGLKVDDKIITVN